MQVQFTARHMELTEALKEHTKSKLEKIKRYMDLIVEAHVILDVEKYRHKAEITLKGKRFTVSGIEVSGDMYQSIDRVFEKLEKQLRRKKDRLLAKRGIRQEERTGDGKGGLPGSDDEIDAEEIVKKEIEEKIVVTEEAEIEKLTLDEALLRIEDDQAHVFLFQEPASDQVFSVLYRRPDGKFGVIRAK